MRTSSPAVPIPPRTFYLGSSFARTHLATEAQRAAYLVLVCDRARWWSAGEIALVKNLDESQIAHAVAGFVTAGFLARSPDDGKVRWIIDPAEILGHGESSQPHDPVCGRGVETDTPFRTGTKSGAPVLFCSAACLDLSQQARYGADPAGRSARIVVGFRVVNTVA